MLNRCRYLQDSASYLITICLTSRRTGVSDGRDWTRQSDWTGLLFFVSAVLLSTFILLFLLSSSFSLSYFNLAVPMRKCLGKHSCMSSPFCIAILNGTCSLRAPMLFCGDVPAIKQLTTNKKLSAAPTTESHPSLRARRTGKPYKTFYLCLNSMKL